MKSFDCYAHFDLQVLNCSSLIIKMFEYFSPGCGNVVVKLLEEKSFSKCAQSGIQVLRCKNDIQVLSVYEIYFQNMPIFLENYSNILFEDFVVGYFSTKIHFFAGRYFS